MKRTSCGELTRRSLAVLGLGAALAFTAGAAAQDKILLRFSTAAPPADFLSRSLEKFKTDLEAAAPNRFDIKLHPASSLFRQGTEIPAIQRGNLEMSTMTAFEVAQQIAEWGFLNRAYLFRDWPHVLQVFGGPIGERYRKDVADKMGIVVLSTTYLGTRQVNLRVARPVKAPADLAGLKLRMPSGPEWLLLGQAIGVAPTPMAMPEVYLALKTGSIDGQDNPLTLMSAAKFYEVTKQVVLTSHLVQPVFFALRKETWDKMSAEQKKQVQTAAEGAAKWNSDTRLADEKSVAERIKGLGLEVTAPDLKPFRDNADKVYSGADLAKGWNKDLMQQVLNTK
jgi:tripartite ATP-independent transporter DctP family solute receptor